MATDDLGSKLEQWAQDRRILPRPDFMCVHYEKCQESRRGRYPHREYLLQREKTCMMSYVGRHYESTTYRLAVVGMDHRGDGDDDDRCGDFDDRRDGIEDCYYQQRKPFNPHYAGVVRTAAAVFGHGGYYCLQNCSKTCAGVETQCVLLSIAQPNLVKCANAPNGGCLATKTMYRLCAGHLVSELELLQPQLVIFHGAKEARLRAFPDAVKRQGRVLEPIVDAPEAIRDRIFTMMSGTRYLVLFLPHPSRGWLNRRWQEVMEPALQFLRAKNAIPK